MRYSQLKCLAMAVREGSFADAARKLYISPQAVSKSIRSLEEEMPEPLFVKAGRTVEPTPFAVELAFRAEEALRGFEDLSDFVAGYESSQGFEGAFSLCIAETPHRCTIFRKEDFDPLQAEHPGLRLKLHFHPNDACASAVKNGLVDAAVVQGKVQKSGVGCRRIASLQMHAAMADSHPLARKDALSLGDLDGRLMARPLDFRCALSLLKERCEELGVWPHVVDVGIDAQSCIRFMQAGGIVLVAGDAYLRTSPPCGRAIPFRKEERLSVPVYLAFPTPASPEAKGLHAYLSRVVKRCRGRF